MNISSGWIIGYCPAFLSYVESSLPLSLPHEGTIRKDRLHSTPVLLAPWSWTSEPRASREVNACLNHLIYGSLFSSPKWIRQPLTVWLLSKKTAVTYSDPFLNEQNLKAVQKCTDIKICRCPNIIGYLALRNLRLVNVFVYIGSDVTFS